MNRVHTVACLTGAGTAPELMGEALVALDAVARMHGFALEQVHAPFGGVALARLGQHVPASTRHALLGADAVLVAGAEEPTLADVMSELDLRARLTRVRFGRQDDVAFVTAVREPAAEWAVEQAFALAGHGIVNPSSMLLAAALALEHGLGQPAAAATLAGAVSAALVDGPRTPDLLRRGVGATTREFTSRVLAGFQLSVRNAEFWPETA